MRRIKLVISYDGRRYVGWQVQPNGKSIQAVINEAFRRITGENVSVQSAGRTDAGVHAVGQVAHVDIDSDILAWNLKSALNSILPIDISIVDLADVDGDFHARRSAVGKRYMYRIIFSSVSIPLEYGRSWLIKRNPSDIDVSSMRRAAQHLLGVHDFESFRASKCTMKSAVCDIEKIEVIDNINSYLLPDSAREINIIVDGNRFVRHMVRNIVGTLVDVGLYRIRCDNLIDILDKKNRRAAGICAPAYGLYLIKVYYG